MKCLSIAIDNATVICLRKAMAGLGLDIERCSVDEAYAMLEKNRYEAVFVNCDDAHVTQRVFRFVQTIAHNQSTVMIGVATDRDAGRMAMRLVIQVPITTEILSRHVKAAYALMVRRRPRSERVETGSSIALQCDAGRKTATLANVSETGLGVNMPEPLPVGTIVDFSFTLPDLAGEIDGSGAVVWSNTNGECGIRIQNLSNKGSEAFHNWLESRLRATEVMGFFKHLAASVRQH
jgi:PilZ domain